MVSPEASFTMPGPNVLCDTWSPGANVSSAFLRSRTGAAAAGREEPAPMPADAPPIGRPGQLGAAVPLGRAPPVERVWLPNTWPPYTSEPRPDPYVP